MKEQQNPMPSKDYSLKEGEKIKINFGGMKVSLVQRLLVPKYIEIFLFLSFFPTHNKIP